MIILYIVLILITIIVVLSILYLNAYNKINILKIKIDNANEKIKVSLTEKHKLMNDLYTQIKKVVKKKDYLKEFNTLKNKKLSNYELDKELATHLETMKTFQEDYKELKNDEFNNILNNIKELDQTITASKKFFNKNNNALVKNMKGYVKLIAKLNKISIKTSYEIKEPNKD